MTDQTAASSVLLVEDNETNILVTTIFLEFRGYAYDVARSAGEAIEKIKKRRYMAILMDLKMPDMSGLEATRIIREFEDIKRLPASYIIGVTAHASTADRDRCFAAGMNDYLSKPISGEQLHEKIQLAAQQKANDA